MPRAWRVWSIQMRDTRIAGLAIHSRAFEVLRFWSLDAIQGCKPMILKGCKDAAVKVRKFSSKPSVYSSHDHFSRTTVFLIPNSATHFNCCKHVFLQAWQIMLALFLIVLLACCPVSVRGTVMNGCRRSCAFSGEGDPDFNLLVCGDLLLPKGSGDIDGALFVNGDLKLGAGWSISDQLPCDTDGYGLVVSGDLHWQSGALMCLPKVGIVDTQVQYAVGGSDKSSVLQYSLGSDKVNPLPFNLPNLCSGMADQCSFLSNLLSVQGTYGSSNVRARIGRHAGTSDWQKNEIVIDVDVSKAINFIELDVTLLHAAVHTIRFGTSDGGKSFKGSTVIVVLINDSLGRTTFFQGKMLIDVVDLGSKESANLLWVKCGVGPLLIRNIAFYGSLLAPNTPLHKDSGGQFNGRAVLASYDTSSIQFSHGTLPFYSNGYFTCPSKSYASPSCDSDSELCKGKNSGMYLFLVSIGLHSYEYSPPHPPFFVRGHGPLVGGESRKPGVYVL